MTPSNCILDYSRVLSLKSGGMVVIRLDMFEVAPYPKEGLFLDKYKLSWIAFDPLEPGKRVLMDAHKPFGMHYHIDAGKQIPIQLENLEAALKFFEQKVREHFGDLEESFYEDIHI
jgi:hypothetical protein